MLMTQGGREARIHYLAGTFRLLAHGDYVRCAATGARIPLDELRYWSVARQEAYVDAAAILENYLLGDTHAKETLPNSGR